MKSAEVTLSAPTGLHARPAGELVKLVKGLEGSKVTITCGERSVNAASMLSLLSLGIKSGTALVAEGRRGGDVHRAERICSPKLLSGKLLRGGKWEGTNERGCEKNGDDFCIISIFVW